MPCPPHGWRWRQPFWFDRRGRPANDHWRNGNKLPSANGKGQSCFPLSWHGAEPNAPTGSVSWLHGRIRKGCHSPRHPKQSPARLPAWREGGEPHIITPPPFSPPHLKVRPNFGVASSVRGYHARSSCPCLFVASHYFKTNKSGQRATLLATTTATHPSVLRQSHLTPQCKRPSSHQCHCWSALFPLFVFGFAFSYSCVDCIIFCPPWTPCFFRSRRSFRFLLSLAVITC